MKSVALLAVLVFLMSIVVVFGQDDDSSGEESPRHGPKAKCADHGGYCLPTAHDPKEYEKYLPEGAELKNCFTHSICDPDSDRHEAQYCGDHRAGCAQSCRSQCCFCCGSP